MAPTAGALAALSPPLDPSARRVDSVLARFPCEAGPIRQLLYCLRTLAFLDPWVRTRLSDYGNAAHLVPQLLTLVFALAVPRVYVRLRHALIALTSVAPLCGSIAAAVAAPSPLLPLGAVHFLMRSRRWVGCAYFGWKSVIILRLPSSLQLLVGPTMWLLALIAVRILDAREPPPSGVAVTAAPPPPQHVGPLQAAQMFLLIAVLPYLAALFWERVSLAPQYRAYLQSVVCVEGCVQLLMLLRTPPDGVGVGGGGPDGGLAGGGGDNQRQMLHWVLDLGKDDDNSNPGAGIVAAADPVLARMLRAGPRQLTVDGPADVDVGGHETDSDLLPSAAHESAPAAALLWPPALEADPADRATSGAASVGGGAERPSGDGGAAANEALSEPAVAEEVVAARRQSVLVVLPASALRGLRGVRLVVAGPAGRRRRPDVPEGAGIVGGATGVYLDSTLELTGPLGAAGAEDDESAEEPGREEKDGASEGAPRMVMCRLSLPPCAVREPAGLTIYILPPQAEDVAAAASDIAAPVTAAVPHAQPKIAALPPPSPPTMPISTVPLVVLPRAAATELRQLHASALGGGSGAVGRLERLLSANGGGNYEGDCVRTAGRVAEGVAMAAVVADGGGLLHAAAAEVRQSGLLSLMEDLVSALQATASADANGVGGGAVAEEVGAAAADGPPSPPWVPLLVLPSLLEFFDTHRMTACLRVVQRIAAEDPTMGHEDGGREGQRAGGDRGGAVAGAGPEAVAPSTPSTAGARAPLVAPTPLVAPSSQTKGKRMPARAEAGQQAADSAGDSIENKTGTHTGASAEAAERNFCAVPPLLLSAALSGGFRSPPGAEAAYQAFKAGHCAALDRWALALLAAFRLPAMFRSDDGPRFGLHLGQQAAFLASALLVLALMAATLPSNPEAAARQRNGLLLLRGYLDLALIAIMAAGVPPWGAAPPPPLPDGWRSACGRYGAHWVLFCFWEPATLQVRG
ncbi:hypothetical protein GPECTOR_40g523 [Gonium pectorale]|uniref:Uncharacterized protein n=1 Tax=Gonium pectorale TaxID=33097 RepID=A0A150GAC5_GONPE|nr:hypothetical protein GPECTOR_40g523 [Gonium pectorale]|eukprot:KXZ46789.1 hypothetical protein GPECTOR_40g523 [Gonium pectorale]